MSSFKEVGLTNGTDKISTHGYHRFYPMYLDQFKEKEGSMLEIGVELGYSLRMWLSYFPTLYLYGIDIHVEGEGDRYKVLRCDQSNKEQLEKICTSIDKPLYFVVDDGSHVPEHQLLTFEVLFPKVEPGGVYIIEDIETSYWSKGYIYQYKTHYGYKHHRSCVEVFKSVVDHVNRRYMTETNMVTQNSLLSSFISEAVRAQIRTVTFAPNCIIITKRTAEDDTWNYVKPYHFGDRL